ncbi:restriction endonuclease [Oleomonas cavernae]|uniref:restriction endonuclease n=1 Tax=Oleomonas cavernae TaxID=2320859 RepID=UPI0018F4EEE4|nr:restriction endonuclease [Oleomonas cavernae]
MMDMVAFRPGEVRYIKLGSGGRWAAEAIKQGIIPFAEAGERVMDHGLCAAGDWAAVRERYAAMGHKAPGQPVREMRDFYELGEDTLWVTMTGGRLWWAFAEGPVIPVGTPSPDGPSRYRKTRDGWHGHSLGGEPLVTRNLSSALTRTAGFRMSICSIDRADYLLRRIRDEQDPLHDKAMALKGQMQDIALQMIRQLHWEEFETLVDLIFARGGWRRTSLLGQNMPDVDLVLDQPVSGETAWVQVKTGTDQAALDDYLDRFARDGSCDRFFFVCHSPAGKLAIPDLPRHHLWTGDDLAGKAIDVGLFDWLLERTR